MSRASVEEALLMVEHAIDYLAGFGAQFYLDDDSSVLDALNTLYAAHRAVGPLGEIPYWELRGA